MTFDPRDEIWNATYETFYFTYYNEILCDALVKMWQKTDDLTNQYRMRVNPEFSTEEFMRELVELRRRYGEAVQELKDDILLTKRISTSGLLVRF